MAAGREAATAHRVADQKPENGGTRRPTLVTYFCQLSSTSPKGSMYSLDSTTSWETNAQNLWETGAKCCGLTCPLHAPVLSLSSLAGKVMEPLVDPEVDPVGRSRSLGRDRPFGL